jgi:glycosyltransferase involved in cell wall biosynthesis
VKKLAIITTHPIQYNAPVFKLLNERKKISVKVFYTWGNTVLQDKYDPGFKKIIEWDIPLLNGYEYSMPYNSSKKPGSHYYHGITNPTLNDEIENWGADCILVFGWNFKSHLQCIRYFKGKLPVLFRGDSNLLDKNDSWILNLIRALYMKWIYRNVDLFLYVGQANKSYFIKYGTKNKQLHFTPHAVDNDRFSISATTNYRQMLGISNNDLIFLFAGKFEEKKNPILLINAFSKISTNTVRLVFVGSGYLETEMINLVNTLEFNIRSRIHFLGFQNQSLMPAVYQMCDVFVLPSKGPGETWGLSVNEAMASSKPIIVSNKCGCALDLVIDNINGFVFESENLGSLSEKMNFMISQNNNLKIMGNQSQIIIQKWSFNNIVKSIEQIVLKITI